MQPICIEGDGSGCETMAVNLITNNWDSTFTKPCEFAGILDDTYRPTKPPTTEPTSQPTSQPTDPTTAATVDPTIEPTVDPTVDPTRHPTSYPQYETTMDLTPNTTNESTKDPTKNPSIHPSMDPVFDSTNDQTAPIINSTESPIRQTNSDIAINVTITDSTLSGEQQTLFQQITFIVAAVLLLIVAASFIDSKKLRKNDFHKVGSLVSASLGILNTCSDILFAVQCVYHPYFEFTFSSALFVIFALSVIFILVPMFITLYQLYQVTNKHWKRNDDMRGWLSTNLYALYMISIICGSSFTGIRLFRSNLFNLSIFDIPLTKQQALHFQTKKVYSTILLKVSLYLFLCVCGKFRM